MKTKMTKAVVNSMLAGAVFMGAGSASAATADTTAATTTTIAGATTTTVETTTETPALLPGDFLYFMKIMVEKIELALTFNDAKQALLLIDFAQERIDEANALMANGNDELAAETLQKASDIQVQAMDFANFAATELDSDAEAATDADADAAAETDVQAAAATAELAAAPNDDAALEEEDEDAEKELSAKLTNNIQALMHAMENVKNENAKASLRKNIVKSLARLEKKIMKLDPEAAAALELAAQADTAADVPSATEIELPELETEAAESEETEAAAADKEAKAAAKAEAKAAKADAKQEKAEAKAQAKQEKASEKAAAKEEKANGKSQNENGKKE